MVGDQGVEEVVVTVDPCGRLVGMLRPTAA
jgi:hypothetical protein